VRIADVNVLVDAFRTDAVNHRRCKDWLEKEIHHSNAFAVSQQILGSVVRIVTNKRIFAPASSLEDAFAFCDDLRQQPHVRAIAPGPGHWAIFSALCRGANAQGNLITDAWFAALAIEHDCEFITLDRDYARFPGLRWAHPS